MGDLWETTKDLGQASIDVVRGKKRKKPKPKPPIVMPDEEETQRSARRRAARRFGRSGSGRASTILSADNERLGG